MKASNIPPPTRLPTIALIGRCILVDGSLVRDGTDGGPKLAVEADTDCEAVELWKVKYINNDPGGTD